MKIVIVIPCYNEAKNVGLAVMQAQNYSPRFRSGEAGGEVVVVDDGSSDQSVQVAEAAGARVIKHYINRGQGAALETGNQYALKIGADIVIHFDADNQHQASEIPSLIKPIVDGQADIVFGSRFLGKNDHTPWLKKWLILKPAVLLQQFLFGIKLSDAHNGFRAMNQTALSQIRIKQDGMAHASEIIEQVAINKLKFVEVPVTILYNEFGQSFSGGLRILKDLLFGKLNK